ATVELADEEDARQSVTLVGDDEQDASAGRIGWNSPMAKALKGASLGDVRTVRLPGGTKEWEVMAIAYD
ncbi:MAG: GreA/GreB family elongation factor, partial [Erythrobacter sp.]